MTPASQPHLINTAASGLFVHCRAVLVGGRLLSALVKRGYAMALSFFLLTLLKCSILL